MMTARSGAAFAAPCLVDQWLTQVGPREVHDSMRVKRLGFTVARFEETIRKID